MAAPPAFAQVETVTGLERHPTIGFADEGPLIEATYEKQQDGYTWEVDIETGELYKLHEQTSVDFADQPDYPNVEPTSTVVQNDDGSFTMTTHNEYISDSAGIYRPYILAQDSDHVQVKLANGKISIDKTECASTYFDIDENIILKSETYNVRTATIDTDVWNHLDVNDVACSVTVEETEESIDGFKVTDAVIITLSKVNNEGLFDLEYKISPDGVKTTAYFTNQSYQNNKFAFTQSVQLDDPVVTLNGDEYDLSQMRGANFDRETLEQNIDLVLQAKALFFQAGLGFEQLWNVNISDTVPSDVVQVNLDYGRQGENQIAIGETLELDPTFKWVPSWSKNKMDPEWGMGIGTSTSSAACGQGNGTVVTYGINYLAPWTWNGCRATVFHYDISAIPDNATITDVDVVYGISLGAGTAGTHPSCNWNSIEAQSVGLNRHGESNHYSVDWWDDINNLTTHPNRTGVTYVSNDANCSTSTYSGHQHAHVMDLGATAVSHVQDQLKANTSVNGVADWFSLGYPFNTVSGSAGVQSVNTYNYGLSVTYTTTPDPVENLAVVQTVAGQADLTWDAGASNTENWIIGNKAVTYDVANFGSNDIDAPNQTLTWSVGNYGTAPSLSTNCGVLGQGACFNGISTNIGEPLIYNGAGQNNGGVSYTEGTISAWIKPTAQSASAGVPFSMSGVGHYWHQNGQWSAYYPLQSMNFGSQYSGPNVFQKDEWTHVVITIDDNATNSDGTLGTQKMYIDGQWVQFCGYPGCTLGPGTTTDSFGKTASAMLGSVYFGGHNHYNQNASYPFEGAIDEYTSWNKVADAAEIEALFHGTPQDAIDANGAASGLTKDNLLNYLDFEENSFPIKNKAHQSDPGTQTYTIKRDGTQIATGITTESYNDTTVTAPNTYQYEVLSVTSGGTSSPSQDEISPGDAASWIGSTSSECSANGGSWSGGACYYQGSLTTDTVTIVDDNSNSSCDNTGATYSQYSPDSKYEWVGVDAGGDCYRIFFEFPLDTIPDSATITDVSLNLNFAWYSGTPKACDFTKLSTQPTTDTLANVFNAIGTSTEYTTDQRCEVDVLPTASKTFEEVGLGSTAISDLQSQLANDWFAVGVKYDDESFDGSDHMSQFNDNWASSSPKPTLMVQYTGGTSASVDIIDVPDAPTNLVVTDGIPITMTWTAPANNGGSAITDYEIFRDGGSIGTVGSTATSYSDSSVVAGTTYSYEIAAINVLGTGAKSTAANGTAGLAPDPPTITSVVISDPDNAPDEHTITWTAGATNSAPTTHYTLYQSIGNNTSWNQVVANTGNVLTYDYTTSGLAVNTDYYYKLTQTSNHGTSGDSNEDSVTTPDVPAAPVAPTIAINDPNNNPLDITITWVAPSDGGSAITGYMIERHDGSSYSTIVADTGSTAVTYVDTASPSTTYMYRISAINIMGTGSVSPDSNSVTTADAPTAPTSVSVASISNSQVDVTWGVPTDDGGSAITGYLIEQQVVGAGSWTTVGTVGPTVFTQAITGLVADTEYNVRVSSSNNVGYGPTAQDSNWTRPDAPAGLSASTTGSNSIDLDWTLSGQTNSTYRIERESPVSGGFSDIVAAHPYNTNNPKYSDTGLVSGTEYNYRIYQSNAGGESLGSNTASNYTQPDAPTNLTVVSTDNDIQLNWTAPSGTVTGYKIERESPVGGGWSVLVGNTASTSTTYDDLNLTYGTQYNYRIAAINAGGGGPSGVAVADWIYPDTPAAFTAATFNDTEIQLQWTKSTNTVTEFRIERESPVGGGFSDVLTPTFASACSGAVCTIQDTGLSTGTQYNYKIYATNLGGENPVASGATNAWTLADPPTVLTATNNGTTIDLAWTAPSGTVTGYQIDRESPVSGGWSVLVADTGNTNVSYADTGLSDGTQYNYRIYSLNTGGMSLTSSNESNAWIIPSIAQNLVAATVSGDTLSLTWDKATHTVTEFKIERDSPAGTGNWTQVLNPTFASVCGGANCTVNDVSLASGTQYNYRIIAVNLGGDAVASSADDAWTLPDAPVSLAVSTVDATATTANITWAHPSGDTIVTYHIERESPVGGGWSALVSLSYPTVAHNDTGLSLNTQYNYRVASENLGGIGPWTTPVNTTTLNVPDAPTTLAHTKSGLEGTRNAILTWVAPANDGGSPILSYKIERNIGGAGWADAISSTGNTAITATDSGLSAGVEYEYRISAITLVGTGPTSNVESSTFVSGSMTHTSGAIGGNTIEVTPNFATTDTDEVYLTKVQVYVDGSLSDTLTYSPAMQMTANNSYPLTVQYVYPTVEVSIMTKGTFTQDSYTATFSSASANVTPLSPFGNNITGLEVRSGQYAQSDFTINAQPAGYDMLMVYQHQDPTVDPEFFYYENVTATLTDSVAVETDKDYYVSLYLNIEDNEKVEVTGTTPGVVTLTCVDILDDPFADPAVLPNPGDGIPDQPNCINGKIPLGTESEFVIKSSKDPNAQTQLGIEGMGDLFGMPMVFVFIVGLAAVFTGRSAQMGSVFIIITIGVMSYLGYLSFEFDDFGMSEGITWTLLIFTAIIGILVGKRWS